ncbi:hypothetical protein HDU86_003267 [Geranomyces michiganensis]|nr:hypothetical protein HDU86_003267 [Geranomyces michiganensis]
MANRTVTEATNIHGTNPQFLIEKIIRTRIYDSLYWKESCFALTAETIIDKAVALQSIGGQYGNQKPTEFLCLALKMLQLQPEKEILRLYIQNEDYKYLRALGAFYLRLTGTAVEIYRYLEPLLLDFRKLRRRNISGDFDLTYMDEFVDDLLRSDRVCDTILPRITKRHILEETGELEPRVSPLEEDLDDEDEEGLVESSDGDEKIKDAQSSLAKDAEDRRQSRRARDRSGSRSPSPRDRRSPSSRLHISHASRSPSPRTRRHRASSYSPARSPSASRGSRGEYDRDRRREVSPRRRDGSRDRHRRSSRERDSSRSRRRRNDSDDDDERDVDRRRRDDKQRSNRHRSRSHSAERHYHRRRRSRSRSYSRDRRDRRPSRSHSRDRRDRRRAEYDDRKHAYDRSRRSPSRERKRSNDDMPAAAARDAPTSNKIPVSSKKVDALFKKKANDKKKSGTSHGDERGASGAGGGGAQESMSVEETNKMRAALGLKPLKM